MKIGSLAHESESHHGSPGAMARTSSVGSGFILAGGPAPTHAPGPGTSVARGRGRAEACRCSPGPTGLAGISLRLVASTDRIPSPDGGHVQGRHPHGRRVVRDDVPAGTTR